VKKKKTLLEKNHLIHLKDIKKNEKQKQRQLKEEQKKAEPVPEITIENKPVEKATEEQDLIIQRKIYPSISMCNPFIV